MSGVAPGETGFVAAGWEYTGDGSENDIDAAVWTSPDGVTWTLVSEDQSMFENVAIDGVWPTATGLIALSLLFAATYDTRDLLQDTYRNGEDLDLSLSFEDQYDNDARRQTVTVKIERDLMQVVPRRNWTFFAHALILHGRQVCKARKPLCGSCALARDCPSADVVTC